MSQYLVCCLQSPQLFLTPSSSFVQIFALSWLLMPLHILLHPTHFPAIGRLLSLCGPPEPLSSSTHLHLPGCPKYECSSGSLRAVGPWVEASPLSLAETGPDCHLSVSGRALVSQTPCTLAF